MQAHDLEWRGEQEHSRRGGRRLRGRQRRPRRGRRRGAVAALQVGVEDQIVVRCIVLALGRQSRCSSGGGPGWGVGGQGREGVGKDCRGRAQRLGGGGALRTPETPPPHTHTHTHWCLRSPGSSGWGCRCIWPAHSAMQRGERRRAGLCARAHVRPSPRRHSAGGCATCRRTHASLCAPTHPRPPHSPGTCPHTHWAGPAGAWRWR